MGKTNHYCGDERMREHFAEVCGKMTPCVVDSLVAGFCHFIGIFCLGIRTYQLTKRKSLRYRLSESSLRYQWTAVIMSAICCILSIVIFVTRLCSYHVLYSGNVAPAPYEYLSHLMAIVFWFLCVTVLYLETDRFMWEGLWTVRSSLCLTFAGTLAKMGFVLNSNLTEIDGFYVVFMLYALFQFLLAFFALSQIPAADHLTLNLQHTYESLKRSDPDGNPEEESTTMPDTKSGFFSRLGFFWIWPFLNSAADKPIQMKGIWQLDSEDQASTLQQQFRSRWQSRPSKENNLVPKRGLLRILLRTVFRRLLLAVVLRFIEVAMRFSRVWFVVFIYGAIGNDEGWSKTTIILAVLLFLSAFIMKLAKRHYEQVTERVGCQVTSMLKAEIHRKALLLAPTERLKFSDKHIKNLTLIESHRLKIIIQFLPFVIFIPVDVGLGSWIVYGEMGTVALVVFLSIVVIITICLMVIPIPDTELERDDNLQKNKRDGRKIALDKRARWERDLISGIYSVKCHGWEQPMERHIPAIKSKTLIAFLVNIFIFVVKSSLEEGLYWIMVALLFLVSSLQTGSIEISKWFTCDTVLEELVPIAKVLHKVATHLKKMAKIISHLEDFLDAEEYWEKEKEDDSSSSSDLAVHLKGDFAWNLDSEPCLQNLDVQIPSGSVTGIFGPSGSGKTSLLSSIVGSTQHISGSPPVIQGRVAFVAQSPLILDATIRENVCFGQDFDRMRYLIALRDADLGQLLQNLPWGDGTLLGEQGIKISKSQKEQIALARAFYSNANIILLDNPPSSFDIAVKQSILMTGIEKLRRDNKTVILVTNDLHLFRSASRILYLENGQIADHKVGERVELFLDSISQLNPALHTSSPGRERPDVVASTSYLSSALITDRPPMPPRALPPRGDVLLKAVQRVLLAIGGTGPVFTILFLSAGAVSSDTLDIFLACGIELFNDEDVHDFEVIVIITILSIILSAWFWSIAASGSEVMVNRISSALHSQMLSGLLKTRLSFYRETPKIQITERLRKINHVLDDKLKDALYRFLRYGTELLVILLILAVTTPLTMLAFTVSGVACCVLFAYIHDAFLRIRQLSILAMQGEEKGITSTLDGLSTIRAFSAEDYVVEKQCEIADRSTALSLIRRSIINWMSLRMDFCSELAALAATLLIFAYKEDHNVEYLAFSYAQKIATAVSTLVTATLVFEREMGVIEYGLEYADLESEDAPDDPPVISGKRPDPYRIEFRNVKLQYCSNSAPVVKEFTATIEPGEHIAVVGEYGNWRSVLPIALYRFVDLRQGQILFNGEDISKMELRRHRSRISFIPRLPFIITGTVRMNLDPTRQDDGEDELSNVLRETEMWKTLSTVNLEKHIQDLGGLDVELQKDDERLDNRQKRLFCLARVLLEDRQILIVDEGEDSKDCNTLDEIYQIVQKHFQHKTVITITNRLEVVQKANRVMLFRSGNVEYGSPEEILPRCRNLLQGKDTDRIGQQEGPGSISYVPTLSDKWSDRLRRITQEEKKMMEMDDERLDKMQSFAKKMIQSSKWDDTFDELGPDSAPFS